MPKLFQYNGKEWIEIAKNGHTPIAGVDYKIPKNGRDGIDGLNGKDGKDAKIEIADIVDKLNKLENVLDIKILKGSLKIEDVVKYLKDPKSKYRLEKKDLKDMPLDKDVNKKIDFSDMRWHGGGLTASGIYTETPVGAIDSLNQAFTVSNEIHNVIGFSLNGGYIHPGEYTTNFKTITFVTAPDISLSGTGFSITYV